MDLELGEFWISFRGGGDGFGYMEVGLEWDREMMRYEWEWYFYFWGRMRGGGGVVSGVLG